MWRAVANLLADRFTRYLMDRRGRGRSGGAPDYAIEREYEDIAAVLAVAGSKPHVIGHSYGVVCALGVALEAPVDRLILYEPPAGVALWSGARKLPQLYCCRRSGPMWPVFKALAPGWVREMEQIQRLGTTLDRYRTIEAPVLMLLGSDTSNSLKNATAALSRTVQNARVSELLGQGHGAIRSAPELVAGRIREFLA